MMPRVVEINCLEHLQAYRLAWSSLWQRTKRAAFTQSLDWFTAYCRFDEAVIRPRALLILSDDDEVLGVLPLVVREETTAVGTLRVLGYPLALGLVHCGAVGNQVSLTLWEGLRHVAETPRDWDVLDLQGIDTQLDGRRTIGGLRSADFEANLELGSERAVVHITADWEAYRAARDRTRREQIDAADLSLDRRAEAVHFRYRPTGAMHGEDDPCWDLYADCLTIARRSRQATGRDDVTLTTPAHAEMFRAAHEAAAKVGALDLNLLYVDGTAAAFVYNYVVDGALTTVAAGYDPRFEADDVGSILTWALLRQSHDLGDRSLDLGPVDDAAARFWQTDSERLLRAVHYPRHSLRAQALHFGRVWRRRLTQPLKRAAIL
jgi:CelD/BcsL family acetyltransferase involved in cellulose biosynthesis